MSKKNWDNDELDRVDWMRRRVFEIAAPTYPRRPLPWKVRMHTERSVAAVVLDADGRFVAECESRAVAEFICFASCHAPDQAMKLIGETVEKETKTP